MTEIPDQTNQIDMIFITYMKYKKLNMSYI